MRLVINGEEKEFAAATLEALVEELGMKGDRVAPWGSSVFSKR